MHVFVIAHDCISDKSTNTGLGTKKVHRTTLVCVVCYPHNIKFVSQRAASGSIMAILKIANTNPDCCILEIEHDAPVNPSQHLKLQDLRLRFSRDTDSKHLQSWS